MYKEIILLDDTNEIPNIADYRVVLLNFLLAEFSKYFPDGNLRHFDILNPNRMPGADDYAAARSYGIIEIKSLNDFFKITEDEEKILDEWQKLLYSIVSSPNYCEIKNSKTSVFAFWSRLLKWPEIVWGSKIQRLLYCVLSIPISSAEAERGFSTLKYLRDDHRSRLTNKTLDAMMRIKLNGPDELDYFAAAKYARKWINSGHLATDNRAGAKAEEKISHSLLEEENEITKKKYLLKSTIF